MKIIDVYDKNSGKILTCNGISVFEMIDDYFANLPVEYRKNYDENLKTVEIFRVDGFSMDNSGEYDYENNRISFCNFSSIVHEFMHMASYDKKKNKMAFAKNVCDFERGLMEGMTEYLAMQVNGLEEASVYHFPVFCVSMLSSIEGLFEPYFIPNYQKFLKLFPNKRDILSLMYSLDYYNENVYETETDRDLMEHSIKDTIDSLIDIELSVETDSKKLRLYKENFMDMLSDDSMEVYLGEFFSDYIDYSNCELTQRLIKKR